MELLGESSRTDTIVMLLRYPFSRVLPNASSDVYELDKFDRDRENRITDEKQWALLNTKIYLSGEPTLTKLIYYIHVRLYKN